MPNPNVLSMDIDNYLYPSNVIYQYSLMLLRGSTLLSKTLVNPVTIGRDNKVGNNCKLNNLQLHNMLNKENNNKGNILF